MPDGTYPLPAIPGGAGVSPANHTAVPAGCHVVARPHPFRVANAHFEMAPGLTIAEILDVVQPDPVLLMHAHVFIGGDLVPRGFWGSVRPKPGTLVSVSVVPGTGGGKSPLKTILTIAVIVAAIAFGGPLGEALVGVEGLTIGAGTISATTIGSTIIGAVGTLAIAALVPPPRQGFGQLSGTSPAESPSFFIEGTRNAARPFGVVPRLLGRSRMTPPLGAKAFTEIVGDEQFFRVLFTWGHGPLDVDATSLRIGETALANFEDVETEFRRGYQPGQITDRGAWDASVGTFPASAVFADKYTVSVDGTVDGVAFAVGDTILFNGLAAAATAAAWDKNGDAPLTLFTKDVSEVPFSVELTQAGGAVIRTTDAGVDEISVDVTFPRGVVFFDGNGNRANTSVDVLVEYSPAGQGAWVTAGTINTTARTSSAVRRGLRWQVAQGQYDVRLTRISGDSTNNRVIDVSFWTALRSIKCQDPIVMTGVAKTALRIRATGQLSGIIDRLNGVVTSIIQDWDAGSGTWITRPTSKPASLYRTVMQDQGNKKPRADAQMDLAGLEAWHVKNTAAGFAFNLVVDFPTSVGDLRRDIASAGRASPTMIDGKWGVVIDEVKPVPVQQITSRNSFNFSTEINFPDVPHAFRVRFQNEDEDWNQDERTVFDDGFDDTTATEIEGLDLIGITDPDLVWKHARFHLAQLRLRPERFSTFMDPEHLVCTRGDPVRAAHDVPLIGIASARVKTVMDDTVNVTGVVIDESVVMELGKTYDLRVRPDDADQYIAAIVTAAGETQTLTLAVPIPIATGPKVGELVTFGETGTETEACVVSGILPGPDLTAQLILLPAADAIHAADQGPIPPFVSNITLPAGFLAPAIIAEASDGSVLLRSAGGTLESSIVVSYLLPIGVGNDITDVEARFRLLASDGAWTTVAAAAADQGSIALRPVEDRETYEYSLRYVLNGGDRGPWTPIRSHKVEGLAAPPAMVGGLTIQAVGGMAQLGWDLHPDLDVRIGGFIEFRHSPDVTGAQFQASTTIGEAVEGRNTGATLPLKPGTYFARARDSSQVPSVAAASVSTKGATVLAFANLSTISEDPGFPGTHAGTGASDGLLKLVGLSPIDTWLDVDSVSNWDSEGGIATTGVYTFAAGIDLGAVKRVRLRSDIKVLIVNVLDLIDDRKTLIDTWDDFDGTASASADARVWVRETDDDPAASPTWSAWHRLDAAEFAARGFQFQCRLRTDDAAFNIHVTRLGITADEVI